MCAALHCHAESRLQLNSCGANSFESLHELFQYLDMELLFSPLGISSTRITLSQSQSTVVVYSLFFHSEHPVTNMTLDTWSSVYIPYMQTCLLTESHFFLLWSLGMVPFHGLPFCLRCKVMDSGFICCNNSKYNSLSSSFNMCQQLQRHGLSLSFVFDCEALRILSDAKLWISEITADVTNFLCILKDWASCWAVLHWFLQDGNSTLQHLRAYSCTIMTLVKHIMELRFSCFRHCHSLCPVTSGNLYNFVQKFQELEVCVT